MTPRCGMSNRYRCQRVSPPNQRQMGASRSVLVPRPLPVLKLLELLNMLQIKSRVVHHERAECDRDQGQGGVGGEELPDAVHACSCDAPPAGAALEGLLLPATTGAASSGWAAVSGCCQGIAESERCGEIAASATRAAVHAASASGSACHEIDGPSSQQDSIGAPQWRQV